MRGNIERFFTLMLITLPVWMLVGRPWKGRPAREIAKALFVCSTVGLLCLALDGRWQSPRAMLQDGLARIESGEGINAVPFLTITRQFRFASRDEQLVNLLGNVIMFSPWGFFLPLLWPRYRRLLPVAGMCLALTLTIEGTQLFIGRMVDVDDLILNFLGGMLGAGVFHALHALLPSFVKAFAPRTASAKR